MHALFLWLLLSRADRFRVDVSPTAMLVGATVRVTCHLPRDASNRWLRFGIEGWTETLRQVDGEDAPMTWTLTAFHAPCSAEIAFGEVQRLGGVERVQTLMKVAGCNE